MKTRKSYLSESEGSELAIRLRKRNKKIGDFGKLSKGKSLDCELVCKGLKKKFPQLARNGTVEEFFSELKNCEDLKDIRCFLKSLRKMLCLCPVLYVQYIDQNVNHWWG